MSWPPVSPFWKRIFPPSAPKCKQISALWRGEHQQVSTLQVDAVLDDAGLITLKNVTDLQALEPFGTGNPQPVFVLKGSPSPRSPPVGKGRHTRLKVAGRLQL